MFELNLSIKKRLSERVRRKNGRLSPALPFQKKERVFLFKLLRLFINFCSFCNIFFFLSIGPKNLPNKVEKTFLAENIFYTHSTKNFPDLANVKKTRFFSKKTIYFFIKPKLRSFWVGLHLQSHPTANLPNFCAKNFNFQKSNRTMFHVNGKGKHWVQKRTWEENFL